MILAKPMSFAWAREETDPLIVLRKPTLVDRLEHRKW
jgi:hypothetical protein